MTSDTGTRRLQTVMFTDIKGFSAMMSADEQATIDLVLEHREIVRARLQQHGGVEHETIGDAFLTLFDSPVNATKCAIAIQEDLAGRNEDRPANRQVWLRIGLHLGDIIYREGGVYGDGVNAAARIEACAEAGGVCVSEQVRLQVQGKLDVATELLENVKLKGIAHPPPVYRLVLATERSVGVTARASKSLRYGKQLFLATAALVCLVAGGFAINGGQSKAENQGGGHARASASDAKRARAPAARLANVVNSGAAKAAAAAAVRAEAAEKQAKLDRKRAEAMAEKMRAAVKAKMAAAMKTAGNERVKLLTEALALEPDNAALAQLLASAKADAKRLAKTRAKRARAPRRKTPGTQPKPAVEPATTIKPRVVED